MTTFATLMSGGSPVPAIQTSDRAWVALPETATSGQDSLVGLIRGSDRTRVAELATWADAQPSSAHLAVEGYAVPVLGSAKVWNIGFNYAVYAATYGTDAPPQPASFIKAPHTLVGHDGAFRLPEMSQEVTAEAELALVIGKRAANVSPEDAMDHVFGVTAVLDLTAADILRQNPRYLTLSKNFEGFLMIGPVVTTVDEFLTDGVIARDIAVTTLHNGDVAASGTVSQMTHSPEHLISFHSSVMPLEPGDIICTGSPGAAPMAPGDVLEAQVGSLPRLRGTVADR